MILPVVLAGCARKNQDSSPPTARDIGPDVTPTGAEASGGMLVQVNGEALTRFEADLRVRQALASLRKRVPPDRLQAMEQKLRQDVQEQFINTTLLRQEAERRGMEVTAEQEEQAMSQIRSSLPPGVTMEALMKKSPLGEPQMRAEILAGIKVNKLLATVTNDVQVSEERIARFYDENKEKLQVPESMRARHILIAVSGDADDDTKGQKRSLAETVRQKLVDGGDFAELAQQHSDCPSGSKGGDLGMFRRGKMVKPFEEAAFSQELNAIGPVVETQFGYHIIQVLEKKAPHTLERERVAEILKRQLRRQAVQDLVQDLRQAADVRYPAPVE